jgi:serine/threonine protein kinase
MRCPRCGHSNRIGAGFCAQCGASLAYLQGRMRLQAGQTLKGGAYEVVQPLMRGGMGALYLVKDLEAFDRLRVLKELLDYVDPADYPDRPAYEQAVQRAHERFEDEARILASLHHPGIPEIIAYFTELGRNYIVMEYVEGKDLNEGLSHVDDQGQLVSGGPYPVEDVVRWGIQVCKILEYLEGRKPIPVVHHDIKPANLVLDKHTGDIRLVDFGTAQTRLMGQLDPKVALAKSSIFGTMGYAPPEQYQGKSIPRSDIYALAATMYHLLTDDDPQNHPMSFPWPASLDGPLARVLGKAVEPDPQKRSTATQFRQGLESWLKKPQTRSPARDRSGDFRVVLAYVPDQMIQRTIETLQQELSMTEEEATIKALSAPTTLLNSTSYNATEKVVSQLVAAGLGARLVEVDEGYSRSFGPGTLRQYLVSRGQVKKLVSTKLSRDRRCNCYVCGHEWTAPRTRGRRPPAECPQCRSNQWNLRRVFKCRVCGHEFAHGDQELPAQQLFPSCPACGTLDWLSRDEPLLRIKSTKRDLGTVRLGQPRSVNLAIRNQGSGTLRGIVRGREPWLQVNRSFSGDAGFTIPIDTGLLKGEQRYQGILDILSNGGAQRVQVEFLAQTPERIAVRPASLDFGHVDAQPGLQTLQITNAGGGTLQGTITASAPWIKLSASEVAGNALKLAVVARPLEMPPGQVVSGAIRVATNGGEVTIPVQAQAMPVSLALTPATLAFQDVPPGEKRTLSVKLENQGTGQLKGRITSWPEWVSPGRTRWSGNTSDLAVELDGRHLADGVERRGVIRFSSNGGDVDLPVRATALGPTMAVQPWAVYLGTVAAGSRRRFRLRLTNAGSGDLSGTVRSSSPWLRLDTDRFSGRQATIRARVQTKDLEPGSYGGKLEIVSNGGRASVVVQMQVASPTGLRARIANLFGR